MSWVFSLQCSSQNENLEPEYISLSFLLIIAWKIWTIMFVKIIDINHDWLHLNKKLSMKYNISSARMVKLSHTINWTSVWGITEKKLKVPIWGRVFTSWNVGRIWQLTVSKQDILNMASVYKSQKYIHKCCKQKNSLTHIRPEIRFSGSDYIRRESSIKFNYNRSEFAEYD